MPDPGAFLVASNRGDAPSRPHHGANTGLVQCSKGPGGCQEEAGAGVRDRRYNPNVQTDTLERLRAATRGTEFERRLWIVGGYVRDKLLGRAQDAAADDIDLVLEGDALAVARLLHERGVAAHRPVEYGQFGTAKVDVGT